MVNPIKNHSYYDSIRLKIYILDSENILNVPKLTLKLKSRTNKPGFSFCNNAVFLALAVTTFISHVLDLCKGFPAVENSNLSSVHFRAHTDYLH